MKLVRATESDDPRLKEFFERRVLPGTIDFSIQRPRGFFEHYRLLSDDYETVWLEDEDGSIAGLASLIFKEGFVLGEKTTWGYATDLRVAPTRRAIAQWAQFFVPVLERVLEERGCRYIFSAVALGDNQATNALIRPTSHTRRKLPRYLLLNRFRVIVLHSRIPFSSRPLPSIRLFPLVASDIEEVCAFLRRQGSQRPLARIHTPENFFAEIARWPGLSLSDFRVARDSKGTIRGVAALYDPRNTQVLTPQSYRGFAQTAHQLLQVARFFRLARPSPKPGSVLEAKFLSFLACDSEEVFFSLADEAFSRLAPRELLAYLHFRGNWRTLPPTSFISTSLPFGFYQVLSPTMEPAVWPSMGLQHLPPEFEGAWL